MPEQSHLLRTREAAKRLGVKPSALRLWAKKGRISHYKIGERLLLFEESEIEAFKQQCRRQAA